jgi:WD40 repeat protein
LVAFSADGERLVTISANGAAKVWDVPAVLGRNLLLRNSTGNWWLRMSADERLLASADREGTIHIWDPSNRTRTHSLQTGSPGELLGLSFEPQGHRLAWASRTILGIFDLRSGGTNTISIEGNQRLSVGISFSPDNQEIMFGSSTNVMLCELPSMRLRPFVRCEEEVFSIAYSPDGTLLAFGHQGGAVSLWERKSGRNSDWEHLKNHDVVSMRRLCIAAPALEPGPRHVERARVGDRHEHIHQPHIDFQGAGSAYCSGCHLDIYRCVRWD